MPPEHVVLFDMSTPNEGPYRSIRAPAIPESSLAATVTVNFLAPEVPTTTFLPPLTVTLVIAVSPKPSAWAAGTARTERARAPVTTAAELRMRMCSPWVKGPGPEKERAGRSEELMSDHPSETGGR
ncbi:hypothetical protein EES43_16250 [Streptomyces sp. ADI96-02]|nr:hypothetical protein EES43_16250 [Streptomyces sp. ADI96-02]